MEKMLDQHRGIWDRLHRERYPGYTTHPRLNELLVNLPADWLDKNKVLLEIGCGKGHWMELFSSMVQEVHGVDISPEVIGMARRRLAHLDNVYFYVTEGASLEMFKADQIDMIYSVATFQHIPRQVTLRYLVESRRVLEPSGFVVFQVITRWNPELNQGDIGLIEKETTIGYTQRQLEDLTNKSGLSLVSINLQKLKGRARQRCGWYWVVATK